MKFGQKRRIFFLGAIYNFIIEDPLHSCKGLIERKLYEMQRVSPMNMEPSKLPWLKLKLHLVKYMDFQPRDSVPGGGGALPYISYIGMCRPKGYGF